MTQKWYQSWPTIVALAALILFLIKETTGQDFTPFWNNFVIVLVPVLVGFGIINNPSNPAGLGANKQ